MLFGTCSAFLFVFICINTLLCNAKLDIPDGAIPEEYKNKENVMRFDPPTLSEEEAHSTRMPKNLLCDGCKVVSYLLSKDFDALKKRFKSRPKPSESDIMDAVEKTCVQGRFEDYGIKTYNGRSVLSGPGMDSEQVPGMMQGGGRWPVRLNTLCLEYTGEMDEVDLYKSYSQDRLQHDLCWAQKGIFSSCTQSKVEELNRTTFKEGRSKVEL